VGCHGRRGTEAGSRLAETILLYRGYEADRPLAVRSAVFWVCNAVQFGAFRITRRYNSFASRWGGVFNLPNPSSRTMALGSTQPLTEMSTRNLKKET
jgi:hypothetical protein